MGGSSLPFPFHPNSAFKGMSFGLDVVVSSATGGVGSDRVLVYKSGWKDDGVKGVDKEEG